MISMEDALKIAAEAVRIHRDSNCSIEDSVNASLNIYYEVQEIEKEKELIV